MLDTAQSLIRRVGANLHLTDEEINYLLKANAEHVFDIELSTGTTHKAYRIQHNNVLGPYKGGIRFHPEVNFDEVKALATLMSLKTAAVGLPLGGGKGGVVVDPKQLTVVELEELARKYAAHLAPHIGPDKDVPAPDVNTNAAIIDWMVDEFEHQTGDTSKASFTGKSLDNGGSLGREAATGRGGMIVLAELLRLTKYVGNSPTLAVQGFGNVGSFFGVVAEEEYPNWQLLAATDSSGGIKSEQTMSAKQLDSFKKNGGRLRDYELVGTTAISNEDIVGADVDVLVLAALGDVVTVENMHKVKARMILELANGPVNDEAYEYLSKKGVIVVPDILANAGGVIVSYLEWVQNKQQEHWDESKVNQSLKEYLISAVKRIYSLSFQDELTLKEAAFTLAVKRIIAKRTNS